MLIPRLRIVCRGSDYSAKKRRTLHFAYRAVNNGFWPNWHTPTWGPQIVDNLPSHLAPTFERWLGLLRDEEAVVKKALLAVGRRDGAAFRVALDELSPNPATQLSTLARLRTHAAGARDDGALGFRSAIDGRHLASPAPLDGQPQAVRDAVWEGFAPFDRALQNPGGERIFRHGFCARNSPLAFARHRLNACTTCVRSRSGAVAVRVLRDAGRLHG